MAKETSNKAKTEALASSCTSKKRSKKKMTPPAATVKPSDNVVAEYKNMPGENRHLAESSQKNPNDLGSVDTIVEGLTTVIPKRSSTDKQIYHDLLSSAEDLSLFTANKIRHFKRYYKPNLGATISGHIHDFMVNTIRASRSYYKKNTVQEMHTDLALTRLGVRQAYAFGLISRNVGNRWITKVDICDGHTTELERFLKSKNELR